MKAIVQEAYGGSEVLSMREVDLPSIGHNELLVRTRAASVHAGDYFIMRGMPYLARFAAGWPKPRNYIPGFDVSGIVEAVGPNATRFAVGDEVFGECGGGACAEFVSASEERFAAKPKDITFEQTAAVPISALAALQGLRDAGHLQAGQSVLINGASGGVGTFAVQIAKVFGAEVTGVCSTANVDMVRSIGADHVIDYTKDDFTRGGKTYDLVLDNVGNHAFADYRGVLSPTGTMLPNTGNAGMGYVMKAFALSVFVRWQGPPFLSTPNSDDMAFLKKLLEDGSVVPVIDRTYSLSETPGALEYVGTGHARGKVIITL